MAKKEKPVQHPEYVKAPMDRRQFFARIAAASGIAGAAGYVAWAPEQWPLSLRDAKQPGIRSYISQKPRPIQLKDFRVPRAEGVVADIGIARADRKFDKDGKALEFEPEVLQNMLKAAVDQLGGVDKSGNKLGIKHFIQKGDIVLIKPNVAFDRSPNLGATSNPDIVEQMIRMVLEAGAQEVRVADNPIESPPDCFRKSKIDHATAEGGGRIYLPDSNSFQMLNTPGAQLIENWYFFHRPFTNVDKVIGISPVKDHNLCHASMGIKNWYGLLGGTRNQFHQDINGIISDFPLMMKPTLTILDGTNILMENGPTGGDPSNVRKGNVIIASLDMTASDAWAFEHCLERPAADQPAYIRMAVDKFAKMAKAGKEKLLDADWAKPNRIAIHDMEEAVAAAMPGNRLLDADWKQPGRIKELHI
jgi:uncharacterized protein (DUF362 family)